VVFVFASINVLNYIYRFAYVESPMHHWDEADLVMVNDLSVVLVDLVCHYFINIFALMFIKEIGL
jgi:predicted methyltransferase